jgi:L-fucose isomerase-like protein
MNATNRTATRRIGVVALARPTFDVPLAERTAAEAWAGLETLGAELVGSAELLFDADAAGRAVEALRDADLDLLVVLQVTFTDATMTVRLGAEIDAPLLLWSFPEPRDGDRLRLNSLCGVNLAAHALGRAGRRYAYQHKGPGDPEALATVHAMAAVGDVVKRLARTRIGVIGRHPDGFDTCTYDPERLRALAGVEVEPVALDGFLTRAAGTEEARTAPVRERLERDLGDLGALEPEPLVKSMKAYLTLRDLAEEQGYAAMAVRCWPEFFTDYGCAACGAMALMNEDQVPCGCEADVHGTLTTLILQWLVDGPTFMADLVNVDEADDSAVFWHCGLAPTSLADEAGERRATIHTNRKKPLLNEFTLKPGKVTIARLSQSQNQLRLVTARAEMLRAPMSYTGTSGVVRFERPVREVLDRVMEEGLEHHYSIAYGDVVPQLESLAQYLGIPVVSLA